MINKIFKKSEDTNTNQENQNQDKKKLFILIIIAGVVGVVLAGKQFLSKDKTIQPTQPAVINMPPSEQPTVKPLWEQTQEQQQTQEQPPTTTQSQEKPTPTTETEKKQPAETEKKPAQEQQPTQQPTVKTVKRDVLTAKPLDISALETEKKRLELEKDIKRIQLEIKKMEVESKIESPDYRAKQNEIQQLKQQIDILVAQQNKQQQKPTYSGTGTDIRYRVISVICDNMSGCRGVLTSNVGEFTVSKGSRLPDGAVITDINQNGVYIEKEGQRFFRPVELYIPPAAEDKEKRRQQPIQLQQQPQPKNVERYVIPQQEGGF